MKSVVIKRITEVHRLNSKKIKLSHVPLPSYRVTVSRLINRENIDFDTGEINGLDTEGELVDITYWYEIKKEIKHK